jgi:hypothetical protein
VCIAQAQRQRLARIPSAAMAGTACATDRDDDGAFAAACFAAPQHDGYLHPAFRQGLKQAGYVEGQNVVLGLRWGGEVEHNAYRLSPPNWRDE